MDAPSLMLLHGLGATSGVWHDVVAELDWPGRVVVPDLAGHGESPWTGDYTVGALAASVSTNFEPDEPVVAIGHSLGGGVALCLASGFFRPRVLGVVGLGIKVVWSDDDVAAMAGVAQRGVRWVGSRDEAIERFVRNAGLAGLIGHDHPALKAAVVEGDRGWRVAQDPMTFAQKRLDMAGLVAAARCPVWLGCGSEDPMVSVSDLADYVADPRSAKGAGHNVQVERPGWVAALVNEVLAG